MKRCNDFIDATEWDNREWMRRWRRCACWTIQFTTNSLFWGIRLGSPEM